MIFPRAHFLIWWTSFCFASGVPYIPASDSEVVTTLPSSSRFLQPLIAQWNLAPEDPVRSGALASEYLRQYREHGDPRFLGRAQRAIQYWWDREDAPADLLSLKGTILQSGHEFLPSLEVFSLAIKQNSEHVSARLNRANVYWVLGMSKEALADCALLPENKFLRQTCTALISGAQASAKEKAGDLSKAIVGAPVLLPTEKSWAQGVIGELYDWSNEPKLSEEAFSNALESSPQDHYLRATFADKLLREQRYSDVLSLIPAGTSLDALLLRRAIALKKQGSPSPEAEILRLRFEQELSADKVLHWREQALFQLEVEGNASKAFEFAKKNWQLQKEPVDALLLLKAAKFAASQEDLNLVGWFENHRFTIPEALILWKERSE